jgi:hypothetical protein
VTLVANELVNQHFESPAESFWCRSILNKPIDSLHEDFRDLSSTKDCPRVVKPHLSVLFFNVRRDSAACLIEFGAHRSIYD